MWRTLREQDGAPYDVWEKGNYSDYQINEKGFIRKKPYIPLGWFIIIAGQLADKIVKIRNKD